jgi:hypothetical protein
MQKILPGLLALIGSSAMLKAQAPALTYTNITGSNVITCATQSINIQASVSNYTNGALTFSWVSGNATASGTNVTLSSPGQYSITAFNTANSYSIQALVSITINTTAPFSTITPTLQNITCISSVQTVSAIINPSLNVTSNWYSPNASAPASASTFTSIYTPGGPGTYTHCAVNTINGCSTCKTFTVASSDNFPLISVASPQNFLLGCGTHTSDLILLNGNTSPIAGGAITYTLLAPNFSQSSYSFSTISNYTESSPGTYTAIVKDVSSGCQTKVSFSLIQDISGPLINYSIPTQTLSCYTPSTVMLGTSTNTNATFQWSYFGGTVNTSSVAVTSNTNASVSLAGNYTLTALNPVNACSSMLTATIYQNEFPPHASISTGASFSINCSVPGVTLSNTSSTGIPPNTSFPTNSIVVGYLWSGPLPQASASLASNYVATTPGVYTLTVQDLNNGCFASTTTVVYDNRIYPAVMPSPLFNINCPVPTATIYPAIAGANTSFTYSWTAPASATVSGATSPSLVVNAPGIYTVVITNVTTGCATSATVGVEVCSAISTNAYDNSHVQVFPNPGDGLFTISLSNVSTGLNMTVLNALGALVMKQAIGTKETKLDLKNEPNGIYFINVISNNKIVYTSRIIKQ